MIDDYRKACKIGRREVRAAISQGRYPYLPSLDEALEGIGSAGELPIGVREIPMELIVGTRTQGRANVFSCGFMPIADDTTEFALKWSGLYDAQVSEGIRDPIVVYEYLQRFYVQEGNKRVSVLRSMGAPTILASVTRVVPRQVDDDVTRLYQEFQQFFRVAPVYGLIFSRTGSCARLARLLGHTLDEPWPAEEVQRLSAALMQFSAAYKARGGDDLPATAADAFLVYLETYAKDRPLSVLPKKMEERVSRIWDELVVAARDDAIAFIEDPSASKGVVSSIKGLGKGFRPARPLRMAFVYDRNPASSGWTALHEQGRVDLQQGRPYDVDTIAFFDCASDEEFDRAIEAAVTDEEDVIVTASPRQMEQARRAAILHPDLLFLNCSLNLSSSAVRTFYARMYEVKFLMGVLAASIAENHRVGYVASSPIFGSVAEVNAFAIGVSMVDPYASVYLKWLSKEGGDWRSELREDDVRVVAMQDYANPQSLTEPFGLVCLHRDGRPERVALPVWDWRRYYELIVRSIQDDSWRQDASRNRDRALNYWWGMAAGVVRLELSEGVANGPRRLVRTLQQSLLDGGVHPFEGMLVAQRGVVIQGEGSSRLSNEAIASMRWLNENVVGRLPKQWEISRDAAATVAVSGVITDETDAEDN